MSQLTTGHIRVSKRREPRVIAVFSYRYEASLVPGMLENIAPSIHGWVGWDDRGASQVFSSEPERRNKLLDTARRMDADWILAIDPDERFEDALKDKMPEMTRHPALWTASFREMFTSNCYRTDGIWKNKFKIVLFPAKFALRASQREYHGAWISPKTPLLRKKSNLNLYHLRMASAERRQHRRYTYAALDPNRSSQRIGYDYLDDERGMVLEKIADARNFTPPHFEDNQLWAPSSEQLPTPSPDSIATRLIYIDKLRNVGGAKTAKTIARDVMESAPNDVDLALLAAQVMIEAGQYSDARCILEKFSKNRGPNSVTARWLMSKAMAGEGNQVEARKQMDALSPEVLNWPILKDLYFGGSFKFTRRTALWRRWSKSKMKIREGSNISQSNLAVVVIGVKSPSELAITVGSLISQDTPCEIVVINSGGRAASRFLTPYLDRIRLIDVEEKLFVGAARNIGIDASRARSVAFLASGCQASPGWVSARVSHHKNGEQMVSSSILPLHPRNRASLIANGLSHSMSRPELDADQILHNGVSYDRALLKEIGYFAPNLRTNEDIEFNKSATKIGTIFWAPEVITLHHYPLTTIELIYDAFLRGRFKSLQPPYSSLSPLPKDWGQHWLLWRQQFMDCRLAVSTNEGFTALRSRLGNCGIFIGTAIGAVGTFCAVAVRKSTETATEKNLCLEAIDQSVREQGGQSVRELRSMLENVRGVAPREVNIRAKILVMLSSRCQISVAAIEISYALAMAPRLSPFWRRAANLALANAQLSQALFYARMSFLITPADHRSHAMLIKVYSAIGAKKLLKERRSLRAQLQKTIRHSRRV